MNVPYASQAAEPSMNGSPGFAVDVSQHANFPPIQQDYSLSQPLQEDKSIVSVCFSKLRSFVVFTLQGVAVVGSVLSAVLIADYILTELRIDAVVTGSVKPVIIFVLLVIEWVCSELVMHTIKTYIDPRSQEGRRNFISIPNRILRITAALIVTSFFVFMITKCSVLIVIGINDWLERYFRILAGEMILMTLTVVTLVWILNIMLLCRLSVCVDYRRLSILILGCGDDIDTTTTNTPSVPIQSVEGATGGASVQQAWLSLPTANLFSRLRGGRARGRGDGYAVLLSEEDREDGGLGRSSHGAAAGTEMVSVNMGMGGYPAHYTPPSIYAPPTGPVTARPVSAINMA